MSEGSLRLSGVDLVTHATQVRAERVYPYDAGLWYALTLWTAKGAGVAMAPSMDGYSVYSDIFVLKWYACGDTWLKPKQQWLTGAFRQKTTSSKPFSLKSIKSLSSCTRMV